MDVKFHTTPMAPVITQASHDYSGPLAWWYRFTAPPPASADASLQQRELARRGRLTSATLLIVIILLLAAVPVALLGPNHVLLFILLIPLTIDTTALLFNRAGKIGTAGILVVVGIEVGVGLSIIGPATATGLSTYLLPQYDLLVQALFVAVSLLPPRSVFLLAFIHSAFIGFSVIFFPHTAEFSQTLAVNGYEVFLRPLTLQFIVATVTYLWVTGAQQAIIRADRAEEVAALEQQKLELQDREIEHKRQLDFGIQQILQTHVQVANGNFAARAPLGQDNVLWQIARALNNLLARLQRLSQAEYELERAKSEAAYVAEAIHRARSGQSPTPLKQTGTHLDPIINELTSTYYGQPFLPSENQSRFPQPRPPRRS